MPGRIANAIRSKLLGVGAADKDLLGRSREANSHLKELVKGNERKNKADASVAARVVRVTKSGDALDHLKREVAGIEREQDVPSILRPREEEPDGPGHDAPHAQQ